MPPAGGDKAGHRVAIIAEDQAALAGPQAALIQALLAGGADVMALYPDSEHRGPPPGEPQAGDGPGQLTFARFRLDDSEHLPFRWRSAVTSLPALLADWQPTTVFASGPRTAAHGAIAGRASGARQVILMAGGLVRPAGGDGMRRGWIGGELQRRRRVQAIRASDLVVLGSASDCDALLADRSLSHTQRRLVLAGPGIDIAAFPELPLPSIAGGLGLLMTVAGTDSPEAAHVIAAAALVQARAPNARLVLAALDQTGSRADAGSGFAVFGGPGSTAASSRGTIANVHAVVHWCVDGRVPSLVIEAMSQGRPIVLADGDADEIAVRDGENGLIVRPASPEALAAAVLGLLKRPDLLPRMARASRARAVAHFDERSIAAKLLAEAGLNRGG